MEALAVDTSDAEWQTTRDETSRHFLGIGADEFVRRYNAGEYDEEVAGLMAVLSLFPELD